MKIFSELDETKAEGPIFPDTTMESKAYTEEGTEVATPCGGAGSPWPRHHMVWAPREPTDIALLPIYCPRRENPK